MKASPEVTLSSPVNIRNAVVLPAPFAPSSPKHSPSSMPTVNCGEENGVRD